MRIFKGIENIHAVIERHENEWRREQGEQVEEQPTSYGLEESVRRRMTKSAAEGSGRFSPDRFLGGSAKKKSEKPGEVENLENEEIEENEEFENPEPELVSVIKQEGIPHSWLYNEVIKAINDATGGKKNTKVVAIFIPVIQNGKEFEDLPVDASVTLPPVTEDELRLEEVSQEEIEESERTVEAIIDGFEKIEEEQEAQAELKEVEKPEENSELENENEEPTEPIEEIIEEPAPVEKEIEPEPEPEPEAESIPETLPEEIIEAATEAPAPDEDEIEEIETEVPEAQAQGQEEHHDFNLLPEGQEHPDEEIAEAFNTMQAKFDEALAQTPPEPEPETEATEDLAEPEALEEEILEEESESEELLEPEEPEISEPEALDFEEIPVIKDDEEDEAPVEELIEEVTEEPREAETHEIENETEESDEPKPAPLEEFDDEVFIEPMEAINRLNELPDDDESLHDEDDDEVIKLNTDEQ